MSKKTKEKPRKLLELEAGEYKLIRVSAKLLPNTYKKMIEHMDELGIIEESTYVQMSIALMNQSKSGIK